MTPFTPRQLARIQRALHPPTPVPKTGLEAHCRTLNLSYASMRKLIREGRSMTEATLHCRANGLTYIPRGQPKLGLRRTIRPAKPTPPKP